MLPINYTLKAKYPRVINDAVSEYIHNQIPIYLLDLTDMRLLHRSTIGQLLRSDTDKYTEQCVLKQPVSRPTDHDLHELRHSTEKWIKDKTAYAIFSHRWLGKDELTFQDITKLGKLSKAGFLRLTRKRSRTICGSADILDQVIDLAKETDGPHSSTLLHIMVELCRNLSLKEREDCQGFVKLIEFCKISSLYGRRFVWLDTGCIDKSSSAELEESIRSMFNWYYNSQICIIHLADTTDVPSLRRDPWFTRGWTLQELVAPKSVKFYGKSWEPIIPSNSPDNDKDSDSESKRHLWDHISYITKISRERIFDFEPGIHQARDALMWLSKRRTTRMEDMAYCLIGLLDIPLSITYGEGKKAFYRLQVEILQRTPDMALFSWLGQAAAGNSMLAAEPLCFSSLSLQPLQPLFPRTATDHIDQSFSLTNYGLRIPLSVYSFPDVTLKVKGIKTVELPTSEGYELFELAVLGEIATQPSEEKKGLAILLCFRDGRWTRMPTSEHIILSRPIDNAWQKPVTKFIQ